MTFLPIVERELRVAARRSGTHGARMKIAGLATLALAVCFFISMVDHTLSLGRILFWSLSWGCMIFCLAAGRIMTADCLSSEKRDGTLGLLFLTDLKGYDIVLGKLAATSLDGFYGLLAVFPILAIPLTAGGMTNGEFWRTVLVLVNTFLFSATIGLYVSAVSRDEQKVKGANLALLLWLTLVPPGLAGLLATFVPGFAAEQQLFYTCPVYSFLHGADALYTASPKDFWWSVGITFTLTILLATLASLKAPRAWQDKPMSPGKMKRKGAQQKAAWSEARLKKASALRKPLLDRNAYLWLAARPHLKVDYVWAALFLIACWWVFTFISVKHMEEAANVIFALLMSVMLKFWLMTEAGRPLAEDKKSGAFELLLSTPLTVGDILGGQRQALRRQFFKPVIVAMLAGLVFMYYEPSNGHSEDTALVRCLWLAGIAMLPLDMMALSWLGPFAALTGKTFGRAKLYTAAVILLLPWALFAGLIAASYVWRFFFCRQLRELHWPYLLGLWFGAGLLVDLFYGLRARRRLQNNFRQLALTPWAPKRRFAWVRDLWSRDAERKSALRAKYRLTAKVAAAAVAIVAVLVLYDVHLARANPPKPVIVSLSQSNTPVRVVTTQGYFLFLLPDGTLWRWGSPQYEGLAEASPPWQIGTNRNWAQVSRSYGDTVALRFDGTVWTWNSPTDPPKQFGSDHDWVQVCADNGRHVALKQDGTLWEMNSPGGKLLWTNSDWKAIGSTGNSPLALRADGTLWIWGNIGYMTPKRGWGNTNLLTPVQLGQESNWVAVNRGIEGVVRNQAGQSWSINTPLSALPDASLSFTNFGSLLSSNFSTTAFGPLFTTNWNRAQYELRTNGTLWAAPSAFRYSGWGSPWMNQAAEPMRRFGQRSDWVSVWGCEQAMIGLTSDGTLWTWGFDYGQESHWSQVAAQRFGVVKEIISSLFGARQPSQYVDTLLLYPPQIEPRPLMKLAAPNSAASP